MTFTSGSLWQYYKDEPASDAYVAVFFIFLLIMIIIIIIPSHLNLKKKKQVKQAMMEQKMLK